MKIDIEIKDRDYNNIVKFCQINDLDLNSYICEKILKGFNLDRYGDLNKPVEQFEDLIKYPTVKECKISEDGKTFVIVFSDNTTTQVRFEDLIKYPTVLGNMLTQEDTTPVISQIHEEAKEEEPKTQKVKRNRRQIQSK